MFVCVCRILQLIGSLVTIPLSFFSFCLWHLLPASISWFISFLSAFSRCVVLIWEESICVCDEILASTRNEIVGEGEEDEFAKGGKFLPAKATTRKEICCWCAEAVRSLCFFAFAVLFAAAAVHFSISTGTTENQLAHACTRYLITSGYAWRLVVVVVVVVAACKVHSDSFFLSSFPDSDSDSFCQWKLVKSWRARFSVWFSVFSAILTVVCLLELLGNHRRADYRRLLLLLLLWYFHLAALLLPRS